MDHGNLRQWHRQSITGSISTQSRGGATFHCRARRRAPEDITRPLVDPGDDPVGLWNSSRDDVLEALLGRQVTVAPAKA